MSIFADKIEEKKKLIVQTDKVIQSIIDESFPLLMRMRGDVVADMTELDELIARLRQQVFDKKLLTVCLVELERYQMYVGDK
jgi:hypothetical protein